MGRNRVSDDLDHVADTSTATTKSKQPPPKPQPIPPFKPMKITQMTHGLGKLPSHMASTPYSVFSLFFSDDLLQKIVEHTNEYAENHCTNTNKPHARKWYSTSLKELRAYIATCIYMGVHSESSVPEY